MEALEVLDCLGVQKDAVLLVKNGKLLPENAPAGEPLAKCAKCEMESCVYLAYGPVSLCAKHFARFFERRFLKTIREFNLLRGSKRVGVALSGGKDSTVTLHLLKPLAEEMRIELVAVSVDEGIAGYRDRLLAAARENCKKLGVEHHVYSFREELGFTMDDIASLEDRNATCAYCGVFRRWILNKVARELALDRIATGHNLDDAAQTVLMNIMRNEPSRLLRFGAKGGAVEESSFVGRIKPLFRTPEKEVAAYAFLKKIQFEKPACPYAGEAFRNLVRGFLNVCEREVPGTKFRVLNSLLGLKKNAMPREGSVGKCSSCGEASSQPVCKKCLLMLEIVEKLRAMK